MTNPNTHLRFHETRCACGGKLVFKSSTCAWKCYHGSLYRSAATPTGLENLRPCPKAKA